MQFLYVLAAIVIVVAYALRNVTSRSNVAYWFEKLKAEQLGAVDNFGHDLTLIAGADLSTAQYKLVKLNATGQAILVASAADVPIGVLQNKPTSGKAATVRVEGVSKLVAGGTITAGGVTGRYVSADGTITAASALGTNPTNMVDGQVLKSCVANDIVQGTVQCLVPSPNPVS